VGYLLDADAIGYRAQVQGQLWIAEREWVDTLSYNPEMPNALVRVGRDEKFIVALARAVDQFLEMGDTMKLELQRRHRLFPDFELPDLRIRRMRAMSELFEDPGYRALVAMVRERLPNEQEREAIENRSTRALSETLLGFMRLEHIVIPAGAAP